MDVAVLALPADLLGVGLHRLVAMMAVGDQQLGLARGPLHDLDRLGIGDAPDAVRGAVRVGDLAPGRRPGRRRQNLPGGLFRV